jgi:molybdopterin converting factor small subunit
MANSASPATAPTITVLYFARARQLVGIAREVLTLPPGSGTTVSALRAEIAACHPALQPYLAQCALAVNDEIPVDDSITVVKPGDERAVIPPVSGG